MNDPLGPSSPRVSGARAFTGVLLGLFCITAAIFVFLPTEQVPELADAEDPVFILNEILPGLEYPGIPGEAESKPLLEEEPRESSPAEAIPEKMVFTLSEVYLELAQTEIPGEAEAKKKKMDYNFGLEDTTRQGSVRASNVTVGVDYKVSENATVGVAASQGIHDSQDAAAWGSSTDDETAAHAKYKLAF
jgi:hypothetical protein